MRIVLGFIAGIVVAMILIVAIEALGHAVYPPPADADFGDPAAVEALLATAPVGALAFVIAAYVAGAVGGGLVAAFAANRGPALLASSVGGLVLVGTVANLFIIRHPTWFVLVAPASVIAATFVAARLATVLTADRHAKSRNPAGNAMD